MTGTYSKPGVSRTALAGKAAKISSVTVMMTDVSCSLSVIS
ncbi:hypothetical protein NT04LM_2868, partial [Listeria monocytogenes FSL F2-208]